MTLELLLLLGLGLTYSTVGLEHNYDNIDKSNGTINKELLFCKNLQQKHNIIPGKKWGKLKDQELMQKWKTFDCPSYVTLGRSRLCEEKYGRSYLKSWQNNPYQFCLSNNQIKCVKSNDQHAIIQCSFHPPNALIIDFSHMKSNQKTRSFTEGFAKIRCPGKHDLKDIDVKIVDHLPGLQLIDSDSKYSESIKQCDIHVHQPVLIFSHDNINNLGYFFKDVLNHWLVKELAGYNHNDVMMINIDGLRNGNIMSGVGRFILDVQHPDDLGNYKSIFDMWYKSSMGAYAHWRGKSVCFHDKVHLYAMPPKGFLWELKDPCAVTHQPSYLFQKFQFEYLSAWFKRGYMCVYERYVEHRLVELLLDSRTASDAAVSFSGSGSGYLTFTVDNLKFSQFFSSYGYSNTSINSGSDICSNGDDSPRGTNIATYVMNHSTSAAITVTAATTVNEIRVLFSVRTLPKASTEGPVFKSRLILNMQELLARLSIEFDEYNLRMKAIYSYGRHLSVKLIVVDYTTIKPFQLQVALSHSIDILISFHGAGVNHLFHMGNTRMRKRRRFLKHRGKTKLPRNYVLNQTYGYSGYGGVIELFPQVRPCNGAKKDTNGVCDIHKRVGYGNYARHLGMHYTAHIADDGSYDSALGGTVINIERMKNDTMSMVHKLVMTALDSGSGSGSVKSAKTVTSLFS